MGKNSDKTYLLWKQCRQRCSEKFHQKQNYYDRGISFNFESFEDFKEYVESLDFYGEPGYTLDRIDNDDNYERGNLRWATRSTQSLNQGLKYNNKTGYKDIMKRKEYGTYRAKVRYNGKCIFDKTFKTLEEAVEARKRFIEVNNLPHSLQ